jgi:hypothetical protein
MSFTLQRGTYSNVSNDLRPYRQERFFRAFSSRVRQMLGYNSQRRGKARASQNSLKLLHCYVCSNFFIVMHVPFSVFCVLFVCKCVYCTLLPQSINPTAVKICYIVTVALRLPGLIGTASYPDMHKIRIIGFFGGSLKFGCYHLQNIRASKPFDQA